MKKLLIFCAQMGVLKPLPIARTICVSYHFVMIHMGVDHRTWTRRVQFTHVYNQATHVCTCDTHDTRVVLSLWVTCTA